ncbi:hypothetical protein [Mucilaginibacter sp.]|uniref:hypothetical protein n=1 Tax=Mucilaginibacter sp. TaxID=1882438 RepID=UPI003D102E8E
MIRTRFKKVLLVAPAIFPHQLMAEHTNVKHVSAVPSIFPAIYELSPDLIVFDYEFMGKEMEKVLRRIKVNKFYSHIKICTYKNSPNEKTDSLLKALGVDQLIYREELNKAALSKKAVNPLSALIDASIIKWVANITG